MQQIKRSLFLIILFLPLIFGAFTSLGSLNDMAETQESALIEGRSMLKEAIADIESSSLDEEQKAEMISRYREQLAEIDGNLVSVPMLPLKWQLFALMMLLIALGSVYIIYRRRNPGEDAFADPVTVDDPSGHPVGSQIPQTALLQGGANFATQRLIRKNAELIIRSSFAFKAFALMFAVPALYLAGFELAEAVLAGSIESAAGFAGYALREISPVYWLFILFAAGLQFLYLQGTHINTRDWLIRHGSQSISFNETAGLQVLTKQVFSRRSGGFLAYELNLVKNTGERLNLMNHGDKTRLLQDARKIADTIGKPLWMS